MLPVGRADVLVLDSGAVSKLSQRDRQTAALISVLRRDGMWPAFVPAVVLAESITGRPGPDANVNRLLKSCTIVTELSERHARRAAELRTLARRGSVVDAVVVVAAEPGGRVLTGDVGDVGALASYADGVAVVPI